MTLVTFLQDRVNMTSTDESDNKWETRDAYFRTLDTIRDILGHQGRAIDVLKLDIENSEWKILQDLLSSPEKSRALDGVKQIALEVKSQYRFY